MALREAKLAKSNGLRLDDEVLTAHDRIRETVLGTIPADAKREIHRGLAQALEESGTADPDTLAVHYVGAEEYERAGDYYEAAADRAAEALAFSRAAQLYDLADALRPLEGDAARVFRLKHAEALANAGRGAEAGRAFRDLAAQAPEEGRDPTDLLKQAAYQFTISGETEEGRRLYRSLLAEQGLTLPTSMGQALRRLVLELVRIRLRGTRFRPRDPASIPAGDRERLELLWSAAKGLGMFDPITSQALRLQSLRLAFRIGDPRWVALGLVSYADMLSYQGSATAPRVERLRARANALAHECHDPYTLAMNLLEGSFINFHYLRYKAALESIVEAEEIFARECRGAIWELDTCHLMATWNRSLLGQYDRAARDWELHRLNAFERNDLYAIYALEVIIGPMLRLVRDEPEEARRQIHEVMSRWSGAEFQLQHLFAINYESLIDRYIGDGAASLERINRHWKTLTHSMAFRSQLSRTALLHGRAISALMVARTSPRPRPLLTLARRHARRLLRERWLFAEAGALQILGDADAIEGSRDSAIERLTRALALHETLDRPIVPASLKRRLGELIGGERGQALLAESDDAFRALRVVDPERITRSELG